jgi:hypothetical protein
MKRFTIVATLILSGLLTGCIELVQVIPLDETAKAIGVPKIEIALHNTAHGGVGVTMPDGEILQGDYQLLSSAAFAMAPSGHYAPTGLPVGSHYVSAQATGVQTQMSCHGLTNAEGHGSAECQTNTGAHYRVLF